MTLVFYATDIHGSETCFIKFINAALVYKADVLIMGGDLLGKTITPIFKFGERYESYYLGEKHLSHNEEELKNMIRDIRKMGSYEYITTKEEWDEMIKDEKKMNVLFKELAMSSIRRWISIAEEKLKGKKVKVFINSGNDDIPDINHILEDSDLVIFPNEKALFIDDHHEMLSLGYSNITPWRLPGDLPEEELRKKIDEVASKINNMKNAIFNIHVPPYNTPLDQAPKLDENLQPVITPGGEVEIISVGSVEVRRAIEKYQPLLGLHGHIHESRGTCKIGRTLCINPGSEYQRGILNGVLLKLDKGKIKFHLLVSG